MRTITRAVAALAAAGIVTAVSAGPIAVAPTTVELELAQRSTVVQVENAGDGAVDLQFRAYAWTQADGKEVLVPTRDLIVSPAITTVAPHAKQTFRVLRVGAADGAAERSFRLRLNQIPHAAESGVGVNLEFSLPVFVGAKGATPDLLWHVRPREVVIDNQGARRAKILDLAIRQADGRVLPLVRQSTVYLLAGARKSWPVPDGASVGPGAHLVGQSDLGPIDVPLAMAAA